MATRSMIMMVNRKWSEDSELGFACDPHFVCDKSFVNMYIHHDGYPSFRGVELANWIESKQGDLFSFVDGTRMASHLAHDFHYNSSYLHNDIYGMDHQYTYIIWTGKKDVWISCWDQYANENVFVLPSSKVVKKYAVDGMEYTDWAYKNAKFKQI